MFIGLTYDLRSDYLARGFSEIETAEFDREDTIEELECTIKSLGHRVERIGSIYNLVKRLQNPLRWDLVFNISEGLFGTSRESQIPSLLDAYQVPYTFSDSFTLALALNKFACKCYIKKAGINTPEFALIRNEDELSKIDMAYPLFIKPVAEGTGKGIYSNSLIENRKKLMQKVKKLLNEFDQPVLVEEFLPGQEYTTAIIGNGTRIRVLGTMKIIVKNNRNNKIYSFETKENCEHDIIYLPATDTQAKEVEKVALAVYRFLNCKDVGRIDIRIDRTGKPSFIEINPIPGLHPNHSDLPMIASFFNISFKELLNTIIKEAMSRIAKGGGS